MILSNNQIKETIEKGDIQISPFENSQVEPASYDLRVGKFGTATSSKKIVDIEKQGYIPIEPGDFAIIMVFEEISLGLQYAGRLGLRSKYMRKGLIATTGLQVDPGYRGHLKIGLTNLTPKAISLPFKDDFISIELHKLEQPASEPYSGPYQGQTGLSPEDIEAVTEGTGMAFSEVIITLKSLSQNVATLSDDVKSLTTDFKTMKSTLKGIMWTIPIIVTVGIAIIGIIVALK